MSVHAAGRTGKLTVTLQVILLLTAILFGILFLFLKPPSGTGNSSESSITLPDGISIAEFERARHDVGRILKTTPTEADILMLLAENAVSRSRLEKAAACFAAVPSAHGRYGAIARLQEAQVRLRLHQSRSAEGNFLEFLRLSDTALPSGRHLVEIARRWLVYIYAVQLRFEDRKALLERMRCDGQLGLYDAKQLYFPSLLIWSSSLGSSRLREFLQSDPADPGLITADARYHTAEGRPDESLQLLKTLRKKHPDDLRIHAAILECCFEKDDWSAFEMYYQQVPEHSDRDPWLLTVMRGEYALHNGDWDAADQYFRLMLAIDPANSTSQMAVSRICAAQGRTAEQQESQRRSLILARIRVNLAAASEDSPDAVRTLSEDSAELGMEESASAFLLLADQMVNRVPGREGMTR